MLRNTQNKSYIYVLKQQYKIMGLIREPLHIDLVINSNANAQELEKIDLMIGKLKTKCIIVSELQANSSKSK